MSITEKVIADYNFFYETCMTAFNVNPVITSERLIVATELFELITDHQIHLAGLPKDKFDKLMNQENIFETFYLYWVSRYSKLRNAVETTFVDYLENIK